MPTPTMPGFGDAGAFVRWAKGVEYSVRQLGEKLNNVLANTGLSIPAPGTTQLDGNLNIMNLGRETFYGGSILMQDTHSRQWLYAGGFSTNGFGVQLSRTDGSVALLFSDNDPVNELPQYIGLYDRGGKSIVAEDLSGNGAAWPLAPIQFEDLTWANWANNTTSSFVAVQQAVHYKSSPRAYITAQAICDGTATGEVRLMCNGTQIGTTATLANLTMTAVTFGTPATLPGAIGDPLTFTLETRVTAGAGKTYGKVLTAMAWPS